MKRSEVTVKKLIKMGYKGMIRSNWTGNELESDSVLEDIVYAARMGGELSFTNDDVRGQVIATPHQSIPDHYIYATRKMTRRELADADLRLATQGVTVRRA